MTEGAKRGLAKGAAEIGKAVGIALIFSLASVLVLSLLVRFAGLGDNVVKPINQFVKILAVFLGCYFSIRDGAGLWKGLISGVAIILVTFLVFALISGSIAADISLLWDVLFGAAIGGVSGIVAVNLKKGV